MRSTSTQHEATFTWLLSSQAPQAAGSAWWRGQGHPLTVLWGEFGVHSLCKFAFSKIRAGGSWFAYPWAKSKADPRVMSLWPLSQVCCGHGTLAFTVCSGDLEHFCFVNCLWFALSLPCAVYIFLCHAPNMGSLRFKHWEGLDHHTLAQKPCMERLK